MKNPIPLSLKATGWTSVIVFLIAVYFMDFNIASIIGIGTYIALLVGRHTQKKKHLASARNIMIRKSRLLHLASVAERAGSDKDADGQDQGEHYGIIIPACTTDLNTNTPCFDHLDEFLLEEYKNADFSERKSPQNFFLREHFLIVAAQDNTSCTNRF